jgi:hypothetical protein
MTTARPRADTLLPAMIDEQHRLTTVARQHAVEVRCPERHLLGAVVMTPHGRWMYWRGHPVGPGWLCAWYEDVPERSEVRVWCPACTDVYLLDVSDPANPTVALG